tara:strand:- start:4600 stop:6051 length:1452 start_codon:yes stop_codon:yes gene_type:complete
MLTFPFTVFSGVGEFLNKFSTVFNGIDERVFVVDDATLDITDNLSIFSWVKTTDMGLVSIAAKFNSAGGQRSYLLGLDTGGVLRATLSSNGFNSGLKAYTSTDAINDGKWHHVGFTFSGTGTGVLKLYVDGLEIVPIKGVDNTATSIHSSTTSFVLGASDEGTNGFIDAKITHTTMWDTAVLSDAEIWSIYNIGAPIDVSQDFEDYISSDNLVSWWKMGDSDNATTMFDSAGTNNGALVNMDASNYDLDVPTQKTLFKSLSFDGVNESLTSSYGAALDSSSSAVTMFFRVKVSALANTVGRDFYITTRDADGVSDRSFFAYVSQGSNKITFGLQRIGASHFAANSATALPLDTWVNYVCTISPTRMATHLNGAFDAEILVGPENMETPSTNVGVDIGGMISGKNFEGQIDKVAVWYETLTDLQAIEASTEGANIEGIGSPVVYYKLGETFFDDGGTFKSLDEIGSLDATASNMDLTNVITEVL